MATHVALAWTVLGTQTKHNSAHPVTCPYFSQLLSETQYCTVITLRSYYKNQSDYAVQEIMAVCRNNYTKYLSTPCG